MDNVKSHRCPMQVAQRRAVMEVGGLLTVWAVLFAVGVVTLSVPTLLGAMFVGVVIVWRVA
jgi:hypothetical protein